MELGREDWILVVLAITAAIPIASSVLGSDDFTPETEVEKYCVDLASDIETNTTFAGQIKECSCVPPDEVEESKFQAPDKVRNATELFLISCEMEQGEDQIFPIRRMKEDYTGDLNRSNVSTLRGNP